jgi:DNA-binding beta-propeller fold protein YncE
MTMTRRAVVTLAAVALGAGVFVSSVATATGPYNKKVCSEDGQFMTPTGVATDGSGNVYVADTNNNRIQKFACP